jgi:hypothetical protein
MQRLYNVSPRQVCAEKFIPFGIRCIFEFWKDLKVGFIDLNGAFRPGTAFKKKGVAKPWSNRGVIFSLAKGRPKIKSAAHGFLCTIIKIVSK